MSTRVPRPAPSVSRRAALFGAGAVGAGALGVVATGCTPYTVDKPVVSRPTPSGPAGQDPDVALAATVLAREQDMLDRLTTTADRHRRLALLLADARSVHEEHVRLLRAAVPSPAASPSSTGASAVDRDRDTALAVLARHEDALCVVGKRSAFAAQSGTFARVLASMAAAAAQQATAIRALAHPVGRRG